MPEYDFTVLSPLDFELLTRDLLNAEYDLKLVSHPSGRDHGIDLRGESSADGIVVVQCKHYPRASKSGLMRAVREEAHRPQPPASDRYIFVTSNALLPQARDDIIAEFAAAGWQLSLEDVWGRDNLNAALGRHPEVERQHFKLWLTSTGVLESIIDSGRWQRSEAVLDRATEHSKYWVEVREYAAARAVLDRHGVCVLAGPPGAGKSFLAEMLLLTSAQDDWNIIDVSNDLEEAWRAFRPGTKQLFYCDDFLGRTELRLSGKGEGARIASLVESLKGKRAYRRLVLTTREQILRVAPSVDDRLAGLAAGDAGNVIRLGEYSTSTKANILFNHLYFSELNPSERARLSLDNRIRTAVEHPAYNPRLVALVTAAFTNDTTAGDVIDRLLAVLDDPRDLWHATFTKLDALRREILLTLATLPYAPCPADSLLELVKVPDAVSWTPALRELEPTWLRLVGYGPQAAFVLANPGCRDYLLAVLDDSAVAAERLRKVERLDQLATLTACAAERPNLACVLSSERNELVGRAAELARSELAAVAAQPDKELAVLRDALLVAKAYGAVDTTAWVFDLVEHDAEAPWAAAGFPTLTWLRLAEELAFVPAADPGRQSRFVHALVNLGLAKVRTVGDLDAYEAFPPELLPATAADDVRADARRIIQAELDDLTYLSDDPETLTADALSLQQRARSYGIEVDIASLLDRAEDLAHTTAQPGWMEPAAADDDDDDDPDLGSLFSRLRD